MSKLRKAGSFLTAGVLAATVSVAGMSAASAVDGTFELTEQLVDGRPYISNWGFTAEGLDTSATFRSIPVASYVTIELENNVITGATWDGNDGPAEEQFLEIADKAGMTVGSDTTVDDIVSWISESDENAEAFANAAVNIEDLDSRGVEMVYDSDKGAWMSSGAVSEAIGANTAMAGLHLVYSPNGDFSSFLIATPAVYDGITYYPEGQGAGYASIKTDVEVEEGPGTEGGVYYGDVTVNVENSEGTGLPGVTVTAAKAYSNTEGFTSEGDSVDKLTDSDGAASFEKLVYYDRTDGEDRATTFNVSFTYGGVYYQQGLRVYTNVDGDVLVFTSGEVVANDGWGVNNAGDLTASYDGNGKFTLTLNGVGGGSDSSLPVTGAAGIGALVVVALLALGGGLALRRKKYQSEEA